ERVLTLAEIDAWVKACAAARAPFAHLREPHFHFHPALLAAPADALLEGYWQSERYFADVAPLIRRIFTLQEPLDAANEALLAAITGCESASVHVRRTDYVDNPHTRAVHGVCAPEYYDACVKRLVDEIPRLHFFLFSDDPDWTERHLAPRLPAPCT